ncbi:MAG TPA: hypothetical protein DHD79_10095 [Firmicutes bacterium]|nr:hypothetical protein [Bacillota bacterium]
MAHPQLTTVRQDAQQLGKVSIAVMNRLLAKQGNPEDCDCEEAKNNDDVVVDVSLIIRASTTAKPGAF